MSKLDGNLELLRRIDEKDFLTSREHREFLDLLKKELKRLHKQDELLDILKKYRSNDGWSNGYSIAFWKIKQYEWKKIDWWFIDGK